MKRYLAPALIVLIPLSILFIQVARGDEAPILMYLWGLLLMIPLTMIVAEMMMGAKYSGAKWAVVIALLGIIIFIFTRS